MPRSIVVLVVAALIGLPVGAHAASRAIVAAVRGVEARSMDTATQAEVVRSGRSVRVAPPGNVLLVVAGHTDARGTATSNLRLAQRRAATVAAALRGGMPDVRIAVRSHDEGRPVASDATARGRARIRRVEVRALR